MMETSTSTVILLGLAALGWSRKVSVPLCLPLLSQRWTVCRVVSKNPAIFLTGTGLETHQEDDISHETSTSLV